MPGGPWRSSATPATASAAYALVVLGHALHPEGADAAPPHWQQALALFTEIGTPEADQAHALVRTCAAAADHR
jgi:hypothetical protein